MRKFRSTIGHFGVNWVWLGSDNYDGTQCEYDTGRGNADMSVRAGSFRCSI